MNSTLLIFVSLYLVGTMLIGVWASTRVKNTSDFAVAGRSLPLAMVITTSFATWFGAETVMGIPASFADGGLREIIEDPFGASMCLVLVGVFFAAKLYRLNLLTIGDFYRQRYGSVVEVLCSVMIILSYLGWVGAQIKALGLVFSILSGDMISVSMGMCIGTALVLIYVMLGGMLAVAYTDFIQMIVLIVGLIYIAIASANLAGGSGVVFQVASERDWFRIAPEATFIGWATFLSAAITMMLGSIPQQDVFQRVMSAKNESTARWGAIIGGLCYLMFAFIPIFCLVAAIVVMPVETEALMANGKREFVLPTLILTKMPLLAQILFFGALVSAIKSTSSATLLAPSTSFVENILRYMVPKMDDRQSLRAMRITIFVFTAMVLTYSILHRESDIYELVSAAYQIPLVGSFIPLVFGLYWRGATTQGAIASIVAGIGVWMMINSWPYFESMIYLEPSQAEIFPAPLAGVLAALVAMIAGSLAPQWIGDTQVIDPEVSPV